MVVFGLGKDLLFKSVLARCAHPLPRHFLYEPGKIKLRTFGFHSGAQQSNEPITMLRFNRVIASEGKRIRDKRTMGLKGFQL